MKKKKFYFFREARYWNKWTLGMGGSALFVALPLFFILFYLFQAESDTWRFFKQSSLLNTYFKNTVWFVGLTGLLSAIFGILPAWFVSTYRFPFSSVLEWALILPLAIPVYVMAYTYSGIFDITGVLQTTLRTIFGWKRGEYAFFEIKSFLGLVFVFSVALYPYVYLLARDSFRQQTSIVLEISRLFGYSSVRAFCKVALPLALPSIFLGVFLVQMECLSDYGTVTYYGVSTYTVGIYKAWYGYQDKNAAMQLTARLLLFALVVSVLFWWVVRHQKRYQLYLHQFKPERTPLSSYRAILACGVCLIPFLLGFLIPVLQLLYWMFQTHQQFSLTVWLPLIRNSFLLAFGTAILTVFLAVLIGYTLKIYENRWTLFFSKVATMGYVLPSSVVAFSVMSLCHFFDQQMGQFLSLFLSNSLIALLFAYVVRFLTVAFHSVEAGFTKVGKKIDEVSFSLGTSPLKTLLTINLPLMKYSLLSAIILVFLDVLKEFNLTFLVGPSFETLATATYSLAITHEDMAESSVLALLIICMGIFILTFAKFILETPNKNSFFRRYVYASDPPAF